MRIFLLIVALLVCGYSYSDEASNHKTITQGNEQPKQANNQTYFDTSSLEKTIRNSIKEASEKKDANSDEKLQSDRKLVEYTGQLSLFTKWLVFATIALAIVSAIQTHLLRKTVNLAREEFISTHRPRLRVRNFVINKWTPIPIGQFYISNIGDTQATITEVKCIIREYARPSVALLPQRIEAVLPMKRPYEGEDPERCSIVLAAGGSAQYPISGDSTLIDRYSPIADNIAQEHNLFVFGFVEYEDGNGIKRKTAFARKFSRERRCFVTVDNPDYEHEE